MNEVSERVDIVASADSAAGARACLLGPPRNNTRIKIDSEQTVVTRPASTHDHVLVALRRTQSKSILDGEIGQNGLPCHEVSSQVCCR